MEEEDKKILHNQDPKDKQEEKPEQVGQWGLRLTTVNDNWVNLFQKEENYLSNDDNFSNQTSLTVQIPSGHRSIGFLGNLQDHKATLTVSQFTNEVKNAGYIDLRPNAGYIGAEYGNEFLKENSLSDGVLFRTTTQFRLSAGKYEGTGGISEKIQGKWHSINNFQEVNWEGFTIEDKGAIELSLGQSYTIQRRLSENSNVNLSFNGNYGATIGSSRNAANLGVGLGVGTLEYNDRIKFNPEGYNPDFLGGNSSNDDKLKWSVSGKFNLNYSITNPLLRDVHIYNNYTVPVFGNIEQGLDFEMVREVNERKLVPSAGLEASVEFGQVMLSAGVDVSANTVESTYNVTNYKSTLTDLGSNISSTLNFVNEKENATPQENKHFTGNVSLTYRF